MCKPAVFLFVVLLFQPPVYTYCQGICIQDCSTESRHLSENSLESISCSIQSQTCSSNLNGATPTAPQDKTLGYGWYLFPDPDNSQYDKIALNFSFGPQHDGTISNLQGYKISLLEKNIPGLSVYYCINGTLNFFKHVFTTFYYDCFGTSSNFQLVPDFYHVTKYDILIRSLPIPPLQLDDQLLHIHIEIPSCEDEQLKNVSECAQLQALNLFVINVFCANHSVEFSYFIPSLFGDFAFILIDNVITLSRQPLNNSLVINMPDTQDYFDNFTLAVRGSSFANIRRAQSVNFSHCPHVPNDATAILVVSIALPIIAFAIVVCAIVISSRLKWDVKHFTDWIAQRKNLSFDAKDNEQENQILQASENEQKCVKVYIIFVNDHEKHKNTVLAFVNYLHADLNFEVVMELYDSNKIDPDPATWMDKSLETSDKVIVIWSPGAVKRWKMYDRREMVELDLFTPVLKQISRDIFRRINIGKYYFCYFEYCTEDDIPQEFKGKSILHYNLMKQIEELYFKLRKMEKYIPGGVRKSKAVTYDNFSDPKVTKHGHILAKRIREMCDYVKDNPGWHSENPHTSSEPSVFPICPLEQVYINEIPDLPPLAIVSLNDHTPQTVKRNLQSDQGNISRNMYSAISQKPDLIAIEGSVNAVSESNPSMSIVNVDSLDMHDINQDSDSSVSFGLVGEDSGFHSEQGCLLHRQSKMLEVPCKEQFPLLNPLQTNSSEKNIPFSDSNFDSGYADNYDLSNYSDMDNYSQKVTEPICRENSKLSSVTVSVLNDVAHSVKEVVPEKHLFSNSNRIPSVDFIQTNRRSSGNVLEVEMSTDGKPCSSLLPVKANTNNSELLHVNERPLMLVPIDMDANPMESLVSINKFSR